MALLRTLADRSVGLRLHHPTLGWCAAFVAGVALGRLLPHPLPWLLLATLALGLAWLRPRAAAGCVLALLALGAWHAAGEARAHATAEARIAAARENGETLTLTLTVGGDRRVVWRRVGGPFCAFTAADARFADGTPVAGLRLPVSWHGPLRDFPRVGQTWRVRAKAIRVEWRGAAPLIVRAASARLLPGESRSGAWRRRLADLRRRLAGNLAIGISPDEAFLAQLMTIGSDRALPYEDRQRFADAGIIHVLSISGLHVGIVTALLLWAFAWAGLGLRLRAGLLFPALAFYLLLTGAPPPAARACLMAALFLLAPAFLRRPDAPCALLLAAALLLAWEPAWVADVGALLSFCVMGGILLWTGPLAYFIARALGALPRRHEADTPPPEAPWHLLARQRLALCLGLSLAAWLAALPLCLHFFGRVSLVGLLLNLFIPWLTGLVVWAAAGSALAGFALPPLACFLNRLNAAALHATAWLSDRAIDLPGALLTAQPPGPLATLLLEGALLLLGLHARALERRARLADPLDPTILRLGP